MMKKLRVYSSLGFIQVLRISYANASSSISQTKAPSEESLMATTSDCLARTNEKWYKLNPSHALSASTGEDTPTDYHSIAALADRDNWYAATDDEIASLIEHNTWVLVPPPPGSNIIKNKWGFRIKKNADGSINR
jgi:hypothetical protein